MRPGCFEILSVQLKSAFKTDIGEEFYIFGYGKLKFGWKKAKLAPNFHLVVTVQNITDKMIHLEQNEIIGLACREDNFNFPTSLCRKKQLLNLNLTKEPMTPQLSKEKINRCINEPSYKSSTFGQFSVKPSLPNIQISLPFGDMFKKINNPGSSGLTGEKLSKRDPRVQKLKEKLDTEKTTVAAPSFNVPVHLD